MKREGEDKIERREEGEKSGEGNGQMSEGAAKWSGIEGRWWVAWVCVGKEG